MSQTTHEISPALTKLHHRVAYTYNALLKMLKLDPIQDKIYSESDLLLLLQMDISADELGEFIWDSEGWDCARAVKEIAAKRGDRHVEGYFEQWGELGRAWRDWNILERRVEADAAIFEECWDSGQPKREGLISFDEYEKEEEKIRGRVNLARATLLMHACNVNLVVLEGEENAALSDYLFRSSGNKLPESTQSTEDARQRHMAQIQCLEDLEINFRYMMDYLAIQQTQDASRRALNTSVAKLGFPGATKEVAALRQVEAPAIHFTQQDPSKIGAGRANRKNGTRGRGVRR